VNFQSYGHDTVMYSGSRKWTVQVSQKNSERHQFPDDKDQDGSQNISF
jgi:hypothetical protein